MKGSMNMKLYIKEIAWGIDRKNGGFKTRQTAKESFLCCVGKLPQFGVSKVNFCIDEVGKDHIVLSLHYNNNPSANKTWTIKKGEPAGYYPRSFDGGYRYEFELK